MGGARAGEGERESGLVAEGMLGSIDVVRHVEDRVVAMEQNGQSVRERESPLCCVYISKCGTR